MTKFVLILSRKPGTTREWFRSYLSHVHAPLAESLPGLVRYVHNQVAGDPARRDPNWDALVELWWESSEVMQEAWRSPQGRAATADLSNFADLAHTTWAIVEEEVRR